MKEHHAQIDKHGRLLIPASMRSQLKYKPGDKLVLRAINDELRIVSLKKTVKLAQDLISQHNPNSVSLVDEFIHERRREAIKEDQKYGK